MPSARNSYTVRSIGEALEKANEYPENIGYLVAPLSTKTGGARKWYGLDPDNHKHWMAEADSTDEKEPLPPTTDAGVENLGPLPSSKIGMWEVVFINKDGEPMRPRILIDSSEKVAAEEEPEAAPAASSASTGVDPLLVSMLRDQHRFALDCLKSSKEMMLTVSEQQQRITAQLRESVDKANARVDEAEKVRDMALGANTELHHKLAEHESDNVIATTIQKVFDGKPELLITAGRELFKGVVEALRGTAAAPAASAAAPAASAAAASSVAA